MSLMNYRSLVSKMTLLMIISVILVLGGCASQPSYYQPQAQPITPEPIPEPVVMEMDQLASVLNIEVEELENSIRVIINGSEPLTYNVAQMEFPLRLVVDVAGAQLDAPSEGIPVDKGVITEIIPSEIEKDGETTTRIEVGLNTYTAHYEVLPSGNDLLIDFLRPQLIKKADNIVDLSISDAGDFVQVDILADGTIEDYNSFDLDEPTRLILDFPGLKTLLTAKEKGSSSSLLKKIRCGEHPDYFRVVLDFPMTDLPPFQVVPTTKGMTVFLGSGFEEKKAELIARASPSPVAKEQEPPVPTETEDAEFQPEEKESPTLVAKAEKMENEEEESNPPPAETASLESGAEASSPEATNDESSSPAEPVQPPEETSEPSDEMAAEEAPEEQQALEETVAEPSEEPQPLKLATVEEVVEGPRYTGEHISLDFMDADIRNILRLIAEVSNLNIVAGDDVEGIVTIRLYDVPWDQALDVILLSNGLGKTLEGNILRIAPMERLNREKKATIAARETAEKLEPLKKGLIPVSYAAADKLMDVIINAKVLSLRGNIEIDERTNTMIVIDIEKNIREVRNLVDQLDTPTPQVLIEAKIVQINPSYTRELGISWELGYATAHGDDALLGVGGPGEMEIDLGERTVETAGKIIDLAPAVGAGSGGAISWGYLAPGFGIFQKIAALEKEEKLEIVSSPRIMTLDNQEATVEQGVDIPYMKLSEEGVTSTEFKKATLSLKVKPHVTADGSIMMDIEVKKDQVSAQTGAENQPGIDTRRAKTNVLVRNKHTVVIGGIYEENTTDIYSSVPYLGRIPLLGFFFKSTTKKIDKTELIIFITPTIVTLPKQSPGTKIAATPLS